MLQHEKEDKTEVTEEQEPILRSKRHPTAAKLQCGECEKVFQLAER